ncbi:MAG: radical SAM protein [Catenulispora sp.]|nr:radical SAM protein [Catenulispora sp.]
MTDVFLPLASVRRARGPESHELPYLLINPPFTDPTTPYHSIPYLVGAAREAGYVGERCVDANLDALEYLARPEQCGVLIHRARETRRRIDAAAVRTRGDELRYRQALAAEGLTPESVQGAIAVLRDPEHFYHLPTYKHAVSVLYRWCDLFSLDMPPGLLDSFSLRLQASASLCSTDDLSDPEVIDSISSPFAGYLDTEFAALLAEKPWRLIGLSVNYAAQLPVALKMARMIRETVPEAVVVFGGTEVCDVVKYALSRAGVWRVFQDADAIVPGEGETPLVAILDAVRTGAPLGGITGVLTPGRPSDGAAERIHYENVAALPTPAFDVWEWERYWSPEPVILYSPTRGCYWNKCTFCDYGLNDDRPTSPSRERPLDKVMTDLAEARRFGRVLYFAVDAMSPRYLRRLAAAMAESPMDFKWSAELRLERTFPERSAGKVLAESGCVAVSFGYESGSQRILNLIDKGVTIATVPAVLRELADNGIAAQIMGFTDFPSETPEEALATYGFLGDHEDLWTSAGIGRFGLTPGSIVAKQPERFGVDVLPSPSALDIARYLPWVDRDRGVRHLPGGSDERIPDAVRSAIAKTPFGRPFVGGIDSGHSLLYFARYGRGLLPPPDDPGARGAPRVDLAVRSEVRIAFETPHELTALTDLQQEVRRQYRDESGATRASMSSWLAAPGGGRLGSTTLVVLPNGREVQLPPEIDAAGDTALGRAYRALVMRGMESAESVG